MIAGAILLFLSIRHFGEAPLPNVAASVAVPNTAVEATSGNALLHVLVALTAVVALGRVLGWVFRRLGQPPVIGEVIAGIVLGPSVLGAISPAAMDLVLPASVAPQLGVIAQLGIILYMFLVGLELNAGQVRQKVHAALAISNASIAVPFVMGAALALWLHPRMGTGEVSFTAFALFLGVAMSVTAFPVLARILTDQNLQRTPIGVLALIVAATGDVTAWCLLALVVGVAKSQVGGAVFVALGTVAFVAAMFLVVKPLLERYVSRSEAVTPGTVAVMLIGVLGAALTTELIGIHAIFGAFLLGAIIPHDSTIAKIFSEKLQDLVAVLLLPAFFAYTGMRTEIGLVSGLEHWLICGAIIAVATIGKFGGTLAAARLTGHGWRDSAALGILMNTRGLMELIVLNIGLELGVISPTLFAMLVLMALVTTIATGPILNRLLRPVGVQPSG